MNLHKNKLDTKQKFWWEILFSLLLLLLVTGCSESHSDLDATPIKGSVNETPVPTAKVLYINSYHRGYDWSDGITQGILDTFGASIDSDGQIDNSRSKVLLKIVYMDTKRNKAEEFIKNAALKAKAEIDSWKPDVVITSDDIAAKYLVVPYYNHSKQPLVFCGINIDATKYAFSHDNITGIIEVSLIEQVVEQLRPYAKGERIGILGADTLTRRKTAAAYLTAYSWSIDNRYAKTFTDWKKMYLELQSKTDILILPSPIGIDGWNEAEAVKFVLANSKIPSGTNILSAMPVAMVGLTKVAHEQGEWAAKTSLDILAGEKPVDIPIARNQKAKIYLNMPLAKKLAVTFPIELIERATFFE